MSETKAPRTWRTLDLSIGKLLNVPMGDVIIPVSITSLERGDHSLSGRKLGVIREQKGKQVVVTHAPVKQLWARVDTGEVVEETTIGYEYGGSFVVVEQLQNVPQPDGRIVLEYTIPNDGLEPMYVDRGYLLWPGRNADSEFDLFTEALRQEKLAAVGRAVLTKNTRQFVVAWSERAQQLIAFLCTIDSQIKWAELRYITREANERPMPDREGVKQARKVLRNAVRTHDPQVDDDYQQALVAAVEAAASGKRLKAPASAAPKPPVDLLDALRKSVKDIQKPKRPKKAVA